MIINESIITILTKYSQTINNYNNFFLNNITLHKNSEFLKTIYKKGLILIINVFSISLLYLDSLVDVYNLCEKGYIYFIEFINQIYITNTFENNSFELTLKDATIFSYKKTVFGFETNIQTNISEDNKYKLKIIEECTSIINNLSLLFTNNICDLFNNVNKNYSVLTNINKLTNKIYTATDLYNKQHEISVNYIYYFKNINNFLNIINSNYDIEKNNVDYLKHIYIFLDKYISKKLFTKNNYNDYENINMLFKS